MEPLPSGQENRAKGRPKITVVPRKENFADNDSALHLHVVPEEAIWERGNRIRPKAPRIPFQAPLKTEVTPGPASARHPAAHGRTGHSIQRFFKSRRKGRYRVINFIVLPLAVLLAFLLILWILKFL